MCALSADPHVMPVLSGYGRVGGSSPPAFVRLGPAGGSQWPGEQRVAADSS
jgi:hypothetical protein